MAVTSNYEVRSSFYHGSTTTTHVSPHLLPSHVVRVQHAEMIGRCSAVFVHVHANAQNNVPGSREHPLPSLCSCPKKHLSIIYSAASIWNECQELYDRFCEEYGSAGVSIAYFYDIWRNCRPSIKPKTGGTFMKCHECTLYHDTLNGAPGVRTTLDPSTVEQARARRDEHLKAST